MSLQNSSKHASVTAARFDIIGNFYRGIQNILQSNNHISITTLQNRKIFVLLSNICPCSLPFLTKWELLLSVSWMNISHKNKKLSTWSNICWLIHVKKHWSWRYFYFIYHLVFHIFRYIWNVPLNSIAGRDIRLMFDSLPSPRSCFTVFNKRFHKRFFQPCEFFCLAVSSAIS